MDWKVVPIRQWPRVLTEERENHRFRKSVQRTRTWGDGKSYTSQEHGVDWSGTMRLLDRELRKLEGCDILLQMAVTDRDIRNDGWIRASARPMHPGVILTFDSKYGPLSYPSDRFTDWRANVRGIAKSLEWLRGVDRYGVTSSGEQYTGWLRIAPTASTTAPEELIAVHAGLSVGEVQADPAWAYRKAAKAVHPDVGGNHDAFAAVAEAARVLGVR